MKVYYDVRTLGLCCCFKKIKLQAADLDSSIGCGAVDRREYLEIIRDNFCQFCIKS